MNSFKFKEGDLLKLSGDIVSIVSPGNSAKEYKDNLRVSFRFWDGKSNVYVVTAEDGESDRFWRAKLDFITLNEKTEKEKRSRVVYLVQAASLKGAFKGVEDVMNGTTIDYDAAAIDSTKVMDVFEYTTLKEEDE